MERETTIIQLRPKIETIAETLESSALEFFQNKTIRPILKLQNQALVITFNRLNTNKKVNYFRMSDIQKRIWIRNILSKDAIVRNVIIGMVLGMMSHDELGFFFEHEKECRTRIMEMVVERLAGQVE